MKDNISPEEKLLRLIRQEKEAVDPGLKENSAGPALRNNGELIYPRSIPVFSLRNIMIFLTALSFVYLALAFSWPLIAVKKINTIEPEPKNLSAVLPKEDDQARPLEDYQQVASRRQIFIQPVALSEALPKAVAVSGLEELKNLNLVGIVAGEAPQAIIEDKKIQKTYYVGRGELVSEFKVEDIKDGKVTLNLNGARYELTI